MSARVQQLVLGLGKAKQANISTASATFLRFTKLDTGITTPKPIFEDNAPEIGKGHEFATATFPSHYEAGNRIEKYATSEFVTWVCAYALGNVAQTGTGPYVYTLVPIDPGTTLELPYFSIVEQIPEGGGACVDNMYVGCALEDFTYSFSYGPGRASSKMSANWVGSGLLTTPSAVSVPSLTVEHNMLAASMALSINGTNYVSNKRILTGSIGWKNNLLLNAGFFPGSGLQNGLQVRGRMEIGTRVPSMSFTTRLVNGSTEYTTLTAQTTGTAVLTVTYDANNTTTFTFPQSAFRMVENTESDGIVAVTVNIDPQWATSVSNPFSVVSTCPITGIAQ